MMTKKLSCEKVGPENKQSWQVVLCKFLSLVKIHTSKMILAHLIDPIYVRAANAWMVTANGPIISAFSFVIGQNLF